MQVRSLGQERSPGGGHGTALQDSCLENPMDRGAWQATIHSVTELDTTEMTHCTAEMASHHFCQIICSVSHSVPPTLKERALY